METLHYLVVTPSLCVAYDSTNKWLYNQWLGPHTPESVRWAAETIFCCLAAHPCTKMLSDHSQLQGNWQRAIPTIVQQNFERLAQQGIRYLAWVYSCEYADRLAMEHLLPQLSQPVVNIFDEVAAACDWLAHRGLKDSCSGGSLRNEPTGPPLLDKPCSQLGRQE